MFYRLINRLRLGLGKNHAQHSAYLNIPPYLNSTWQSQEHFSSVPQLIERGRAFHQIIKQQLHFEPTADRVLFCSSPSFILSGKSERN